MIEMKSRRIMGINIGVKNLVTMENNISEQGITVTSGLLKSINQISDRELARLKSTNDLQENGKKTDKTDRETISDA